MFNKRKSLLLGILAAATASGLALGVNGVVDAYVGEPVEVNAVSEDTNSITFNFTDKASIQSEGWASNPSDLNWMKDNNNRGISLSKSDGALEYTLNKEFGVSSVSVTSSANDPGYVLQIKNGSTVYGQADIEKDNNVVYTFDNCNYQPGDTVTLSWTKGSESRSIMFKEISFTKVYETLAPVTNIEVNSDSDSVYENGSLQMTATVNEDATNKFVDWSVEPADYATISDDGLLTGLKAGEVTVTATAADGSGVTGSKTITILEDSIEDFKLVSGSPAVQHAGEPFDSTGLIFEATYQGKGTLAIDHSSIVFTPDTIQKDTTEVTAAFDGKTIVIPVEVSNAQKYYFGTHEDFADWDSNYGKRSLAYDNFAIVFQSANKQDGTITDCPVSKGSSATLTANDGYLIKSVEFGFKQWTTKKQTTDLLVSNDGVSFGNAVASIDFPSDGTSISYADEAGFKAVKVSHSNNSNQIGWEYVALELVEDTGAFDFANMFLEEKLCDDGLTAPDVETWNTFGDLFSELSASNKETFKTATANVSGNEVEQCVARYDYIVGKYGTDQYNDFMGRKPAPIASALSIHNSDDVMDIAVISALAVAGIAAAGAFVFLRRKKEA